MEFTRTSTNSETRVIDIQKSVVIVWVLFAIYLENVGTASAAAKLNSRSVAAPYSLIRNNSYLESSKLTNELDWDQNLPSFENSLTQLNRFCSVESLDKLICNGLRRVSDLPSQEDHFSTLRIGLFANISDGSNIRLQDLQRSFPNLQILRVVQSSAVVATFLAEINAVNRLSSNNNDSPFSQLNSWSTVRELSLSRNELNSDTIPTTLMTYFPNLDVLDLAGNNISKLAKIPERDWGRLASIDISDNPLDCTSPEMEWIERENLTLLNVDRTLCALPPHQNKPKPFLQTIHLVKKVKEECRLNCTCQIDYIWEQDKIIYSKTSVNCSDRGFMDFPDPNKFPKPTDTLYLNRNKIKSIEKFVDDDTYTELNVKNLYLDDNEISSIESLESSDWIYTFQVLSLQKNNFTEVPIHLLENAVRQNKWIYFIDLSENNWACDCRTVSTFKVWLLRHSKLIRNIENVRCEKTGKEIRYLRNEDWCKKEIKVSQMIELLDCLSIFLALLIILVITKVTYDYWKLKKYGKVPWIVSKL